MRRSIVIGATSSATAPRDAAGAEMRAACASRLRGVGAAGGRRRGRARVVRDLTDLERTEPGDVLVVSAPLPAIAAYLPVIGALVSERGGALCALATLAREFGVPMVVGLPSVTGRILDGAAVFVDGDRGVVDVRGNVHENR